MNPGQWSVSIDGGNITVSRPSPHCAEHPWSYKAVVTDDVTESRPAVEARMVAQLKRMLLDAETTFCRCPACPELRTGLPAIPA